MKSQTSRILDLYIRVNHLWTEVYNDTNSLEADVQNNLLAIEDQVDTALLLKRIIEKLDDARSECNKALSLIERVVCLMAAARAKGGPIRGELCTATPVPGAALPSLKRRDNPEVFDQVMKYFGFSQEASENEIARLHYPSVEAHIQRLQAEGKPLPNCLKGLQLRPTFKLTCRCASGVDIDLLALAREKEQVYDPTSGNSTDSRHGDC